MKVNLKPLANICDNAIDVAKRLVQKNRSDVTVKNASTNLSNLTTDTFQRIQRTDISDIQKSLDAMNSSTSIDFNIINNLDINNLRILESGNLSGGTFAIKDPEALMRLKHAGIRRIVDFRTEGSKAFDQLCEDCGFEYLRLPLDNTRAIPGRERFGISVTDDFVKALKKFFNMTDKGQTYQGCHYGIDRTNLGLTLNYLLNPNAKRVPRLLTWGDFRFGNVVNRTIKTVKKVMLLFQTLRKKVILK